MMVFQILFGLTVFTVTRQYYIHDSENISAAPATVRQPALAWSDLISDSNSTTQDPVEIARQANESFSSQRYEQAAVLYERLLTFDPNNVETYNNLGITLQYLGKSTEALDKLNKGAAVDPTYQRIWLTLGFVNSQLGNIEEARTALNNAVQMDADNGVGQSAAEMLESLP